MNWVIVWIFGKNFVSDWPVGIVVAVENDLFLASVLKLTGFMRRGIEIGVVVRVVDIDVIS